jgi:CCR4-NOT transcriptional regulation complex NOT5 subunit
MGMSLVKHTRAVTYTHAHTQHTRARAHTTHTRARQLEEVTRVHKKHVSALEKALRCLDNDALSSEDVDPLRDELDYYLVSGRGAVAWTAWCAVAGAVQRCAAPVRGASA